MRASKNSSHLSESKILKLAKKDTPDGTPHLPAHARGICDDVLRLSRVLTVSAFVFFGRNILLTDVDFSLDWK